MSQEIIEAKLRALGYISPEERLVTNAPQVSEKDSFLTDEGESSPLPSTAQEIAQRLEQGGNYLKVRVEPRTVDINGQPIPGCAAVVVTPKAQ